MTTVFRISTLASCITISTAFVLWPFASFFQTPTTVIPTISVQTTTMPSAERHQLPVYQPQYDAQNPSASQQAQTPAENLHVYTESISRNKKPLFKTHPGLLADFSQAKDALIPSPDKRCFHKGRHYEPLTEISSARSGDWCYGSYCNHEGKVVYWDDFNCPATIAPTPAPSDAGCVYDGVWHPVGADIEHYEVYGMCYGTYCDWTSTVVHWEESCHSTAPSLLPPPTSPLDFYKKK